MSTKPERMFKIYNKRTQKFSKGGGMAAYDHSSAWNKTGKAWRGIGPLKNHLNVIIEQGHAIPEDWIVIEYEVHAVNTEPASKYVNLIKLLSK